MTEANSQTLRERVEAFESRRPIEDRIADLKRQLFDLAAAPRIAQVLRATERIQIDNKLAELRLQQAEDNADTAA